LLCILAPFGAAHINTRIRNGPAAVLTLQLRLIFEKFNSLAAAKTCHFKDIARLPKSLILSRTSDH